MEQAGLAAGVGHYKTALRACTRDRAWTEAQQLLHRVPAELWREDSALCRNGLKACAEVPAGEPGLAARLAAVLGDAGMGAEEYAWWLQACRRAGDAAAAREAWACYRGSGQPPSELCYAHLLAALFPKPPRPKKAEDRKLRKKERKNRETPTRILIPCFNERKWSEINRS